MKYIWITIIVLAGVFTASELGAVQRFTPLPDAELETVLLRIVRGAKREGNILKIQTKAGIVTFENRIDVGEGSVMFYLTGFMETPDHFYLIRVIGYEGKGYRLVNDKTGQTIHLYGMPVFSPDGKRFVEASLDLEAGYLPNLIRICTLEDSKYAVEWKHIFQGMRGPATPVWLNESAIVFFEVTFDKEPSTSNLKKKPFIIEWKNNKWSLPRPLK